MEDTKEGLAILPRHLTIHSQPVVSQPCTEPHLQSVTIHNNTTKDSMMLSLLWLHRPTQLNCLGHYQPPTLPMHQLMRSQHSHSTSNHLATASYQAMEDSKEGEAILPRHLTIQS